MGCLRSNPPGSLVFEHRERRSAMSSAVYGLGCWCLRQEVREGRCAPSCDISCSLNSLKGAYIGDHIYRAY